METRLTAGAPIYKSPHQNPIHAMHTFGTSRILLLGLTLILTAVGTIHAQVGSGRGGAGPRGGGDGGMPADFQDKINRLFAAPEKLIRKVDLHDRGYTAETTTTDPDLVAVLQTHVEQMSGRLGSGRPVRRWDPAFEEFFSHYVAMEHTFTKLDNGIRAEVVAATPEAIAAAHNHARIILDFSSQGSAQMHQPHRTLLDEDGGEANRFRGGPPEARRAALARTFGARADEASRELIEALGGQLKAALTAGGPEAALPVCRTIAMPLTRATAEKFAGLTVARVTDKPRNPANAADETDLAALARFEAARGAGKPELLAHLTTEADGRTVRYYRPLRVSETCLKCHGERDAMSDQLRKLLVDAYPEDKAHGYTLGDLRGLVRIEQQGTAVAAE